MTAANQRTALAALSGARPTVARLDISRHPEEIAADLLEVWNSVETALRSLMGGSALGGQALIRELRQRELISLDQAHSLLEFQAARDRVERTEYRPTSADVKAAKDAFQKLEGSLLAGTAAVSTGAGVPSSTTAPLSAPDADVEPAARGRRPMAVPLIAVIVLLALAAGAWFWFTRSGSTAALERGIEAYNSGRSERARQQFSEAAADRPKMALPHIWLARLSREQRDYATAARELQKAAELEPRNALVHQELGAYFLTVGQPDAARRSYLRSLEYKPDDRLSLGYLGCALVRLGRFDEGARFLSRAGQGPWSACAPPLPLQRPA